MICPSCHAPNVPYARYCVGCHVPLDTTVMLGPIGQSDAEGFALREATTGNARPIVVIGVWLTFIPVLCGFGMLVFSDLASDGVWSGERLLALTLPLGVVLFSLVLLYQTTANFIGRCRASRNNTGVADSSGELREVCRLRPTRPRIIQRDH